MDVVEKVLSLLRANLDLLSLLAVLLGLVLLGRVLWLSASVRRQMRSELGDQRAVLREVREDIADDIARSRQQLQESFSAGLMRLQDVLDQRMNGLQRQMFQDSSA